MDSCIHAANILYLASYLVRDILWLRFLTLCGLIMGIAFFAHCEESMAAPIAWHIVFAIINLIQIARLVMERRKTVEDEKSSLRRVLHNLSRKELVNLVARASWGTQKEVAPQLQAD